MTDQPPEMGGEPSSEKASPVVKKRPYSPPVLQDLGTLEDLTQTRGNNGNNDGGRPPFSRTR